MDERSTSLRADHYDVSETYPHSGNGVTQECFHKFAIIAYPIGKMIINLSSLILLKMAERSEAKNAKRCFASKYLTFLRFVF